MTQELGIMFSGNEVWSSWEKSRCKANQLVPLFPVFIFQVDSLGLWHFDIFFSCLWRAGAWNDSRWGSLSICDVWVCKGAQTVLDSARVGWFQRSPRSWIHIRQFIDGQRFLWSKVAGSCLAVFHWRFKGDAKLGPKWQIYLYTITSSSPSLYVCM